MKVKFIIVIALVIILLVPIAIYSQPSYTPPSGEVEATEFMGKKLTPISQQGNNALAGTQVINNETYRLVVDGLVDNVLSLSYADLLAYPQVSKLADLYCVEGWGFTAKWTGPTLDSIFADAKVKPEAKIAIFYTADDSPRAIHLWT